MVRDLIEAYNILEKNPSIKNSETFLGTDEVLLKVSYVIILDLNGNFLGIEDIRSQKTQVKIKRKGNQIFREEKVFRYPRNIKVTYSGSRNRTSGLFPFIISDKLPYLMGISVGKNIVEKPKYFDASYANHKEFLATCQSDEAKAILTYFENMKNSEYRESVINSLDLEINEAGNFTGASQVKGQANYIFGFRKNDEPFYLATEVEDIAEVLIHLPNKDIKEGICIIDGKQGVPIASLHDVFANVNGVHSGNGDRGPLISCNDCSAASFLGANPLYTASMSYENMKKYSNALSFFLNSKNHHIKLGEDLTAVIWAISNNEYLDFATIASTKLLNACLFGLNSEALNTDEENNELFENEEISKSLIDVFTSVKSGKKIQLNLDVPENTNVHILILRGATGRISVTKNIAEDFQTLFEGICQYVEDMSMESYEDVPVPSLNTLMSLVEPKSESPHGSFRIKLFDSILDNQPFPEDLYNKFLERYKKEYTTASKRDTIYREMFLKAALTRKIRFIKGGCSNMYSEYDGVYFKLGEYFALSERIVMRKGDSRVVSQLYGGFCQNPMKILPLLQKKQIPYENKLREKNLNVYHSLKDSQDAILTKILECPKGFEREMTTDNQSKIAMGKAYMSTQLNKKNFEFEGE